MERSLPYHCYLVIREHASPLPTKCPFQPTPVDRKSWERTAKVLLLAVTFSDRCDSH